MKQGCQLKGIPSRARQQAVCPRS